MMSSLRPRSWSRGASRMKNKVLVLGKNWSLGLGLGLETQSLGLGLGLDKKVLFTSLHSCQLIFTVVALWCLFVAGYKYGFRMTSSNNNKVLLTLNARNELDRSRFVSDLKEAILEVSSTLACHSRVLFQNFNVDLTAVCTVYTVQHAVDLHIHILTAIFQVNPSQPVPRWFLVSNDPATVMTLFPESLGILVVWYACFTTSGLMMGTAPGTQWRRRPKRGWPEDVTLVVGRPLAQ